MATGSDLCKYFVQAFVPISIVKARISFVPRVGAEVFNRVGVPFFLVVREETDSRLSETSGRHAAPVRAEREPASS